MPDKQKKQRFDDPSKQGPKRRKGYRLITVDGHVFNWQHHEGDLLVLVGPGSRRMTFDLKHLIDDDPDAWYCCEWCEGPPYVITPRDVVPYAREMIAKYSL